MWRWLYSYFVFYPNLTHPPYLTGICLFISNGAWIVTLCQIWDLFAWLKNSCATTTKAVTSLVWRSTAWVWHGISASRIIPSVFSKRWFCHLDIAVMPVYHMVKHESSMVEFLLSCSCLEILKILCQSTALLLLSSSKIMLGKRFSGWAKCAFLWIICLTISNTSRGRDFAQDMVS